MMRLTFMVLTTLLSLTGSLLAFSSKAQDMEKANISVNFNNARLGDVLNELEKQSGFSFTYPTKMGTISPVKLQVKHYSLKQILQILTQNQHLKFTRVNQMISVSVLPAQPSPGKIIGKVLDEKGMALPGATIKVIETGQHSQSNVDGTYQFALAPGNYTLEVSFISYQTKRITSIMVREGKSTLLDIALQPANTKLNEVVVTASYKKASVEGLLARQKNASEISNGISSEQIARTPDKNIGESLKRISGVSTVDNKFVLVRGLGERYNNALLDGTLLPSVDPQARNFSFDLIPSSLVDNVVVSKTVTPDMNASFGGGLIQINTKDIPAENFFSFTAGTAYNDQSTGKDFLSHQRGKYDYLGFDDGKRKFPDNLVNTDRLVAPNRDMSDDEFQQAIDKQSKRFTNQHFSVYHYKAVPSQNYQLTIGRLMVLDTLNNRKFGITGSLSYRNTQAINQISEYRRSDYDFNTPNNGASYSFNTTLGALLNAGLQLGNHKISFRNTYTHLFDNTLVRITGYDNINGKDYYNRGLPPQIIDADDPTFTTLLQNKINGQHLLDKIKLEWNVARASINREEKDITISAQGPTLIDGIYQYVPTVTRQGDPNMILPQSRHHYKNNENYYSWDLAATLPLNVLGIKNSLKTGLFGNHRSASFNWAIVSLQSAAKLADSLTYIPIEEKASPQNMNANGYGYIIPGYGLDRYAGNSNLQAGFFMLDTRLTNKLRLVWGLRSEHYRYNEIVNASNVKGGNQYKPKKDKPGQWLPSANITYSPTTQINVRAAFSNTVLRPELMDNSQFFRYNPFLGAQFGNLGLYSTGIKSYDLKAEWFPGLGEVLSVGGYYKDFDKPAELQFILVNGNINYYLKNSDNAKVYGFEAEFRKSLGFIADMNWLKDMIVYGNLTLQNSKVIGTYAITNPKGGDDLLISAKQSRPMYGQAPYLINAGLQYTGDKLGLNFMYNKAGQKTYIVSAELNQIEYEMPREQLDAQVSYRFLKKRFEVKLNFGNILNSASMFFSNTGSYEPNPDVDASIGDKTNAIRLKPGFSTKYENGDMIRFRQKFGRTYSTSITYNF